VFSSPGPDEYGPRNVTGALFHQPPQAAFIQYADMIEQISATVADPALRDAILLRASKQGGFSDIAAPQPILLDLNMPRIDGKILLKIIKQDEYMKSIPIIVLTSSKAPSDIQEAYDLRANCYIVKPFNGKDFRSTIKQTVNFWKNVAQLPHEAATPGV
jgi:CheY-like chemotaxis protein